MNKLSKKKYRSGRLLNNEAKEHNDRSTDVKCQNGESSTLYVFGQNDSEEEIVEYEAYELSGIRTRGLPNQKQSSLKCRGSKKTEERIQIPQDCYIEKDIVDGDTLQNLALKYGCQVAEIKRINNLIRDQDFFALRKIKLPVKPFGLLTESAYQETNNSTTENHRSPLGATQSTEPNDCDTSYSDGESETQELLVRTISIRDTLSSQGREASDFLKKMDNDIKHIVSCSASRLESLEEVTESLTSKRIQPIQRKRSWLKMNGTDCGMQWWSVVVLMFVVGLITPILVTVYIINNNKKT